MLASIPRPRIDELLFRFLAAVYGWERELHARFGLDYQQIYLLQHLRRNASQRVTDIAEALRVPLFQATRLVNRLAEKDYLCKQKVAGDRRAVLVGLRPKGEQVVRLVEEHNQRLIVANASRLPENVIQSLLVTAAEIGDILHIPEEA